MKPQTTLTFAEMYAQHQQALQLQGKSPCTIDLYSRAVRRLHEHFSGSFADLSSQDLKGYFTSLLKTHSWSTVKVDRCGLQFFWKHVLNKKWKWIDIVKPPNFQTLPDFLSREEMQLVLKTVKVERYKVCLFTIYSMGLRLGEGIKLKVGDIDARSMCVHIRKGKGNKDRFVDLPGKTLEVLREFWKTHKNPVFLFPNQRGTPETIQTAKTPMDREGVQQALQAALRDCGIHKKVCVHSLRHSYAVHLVEANLHLRHIQELLGHADVRTTALYTRLSQPALQNRKEIIHQLMNGYQLNFPLQ